MLYVMPSPCVFRVDYRCFQSSDRAPPRAVCRPFASGHLVTLKCWSGHPPSQRTGASGYVCEVLLSTVSSYILGNAIIQFSVIMGLMMAFMGISQWAQVLIGKEGLVGKFIAVELILSLLCGFTPLIVYGAYAYAEVHFVFIQRSLACVIGFLIGFEIPIVLRINEKYADSLPTNIARTTTWDYLGVVFGLALWYFMKPLNRARGYKHT